MCLSTLITHLSTTLLHEKFFKYPAKKGSYLFHFVTLKKLYSNFKYNPLGAVRNILL